MIDRDLADLYGVETRVLNQAVKRHEQQFPADFMFQLTKTELEHWKSQLVISSSERAIRVNIQIIRIFIQMRSLIKSHKEIVLKLEKLERKDLEKDEKIRLIFRFLKLLERSQTNEQKSRRLNPIGYRRKDQQ